MTSRAMGRHQSARSNTNTWFTPPALIEAVGGADGFDLDPCSHDARPFATARVHWTEADNALIRPWFGRVWLNPPYSQPLVGRFLARMAAHNRGLALIFARTETQAFMAHVWGAATGLLFLAGRLTFHDETGQPAKGNAGAPSVLVAYGEDDRDLLAAAPIEGQFLALRLSFGILVPQLAGDAKGETWHQVVDAACRSFGGPVPLGDLYRKLARHPKARRNRNYQAKIRQVLQLGQFQRVEQGIWRAIPDDDPVLSGVA